MASLKSCGSRREHSSHNWKRAARVNCIILICLSALLLFVLSLALQHGLNKVIFFYSADCNGSSASHVNTGLHLLINIISTLVLASSNFFMQILNAPSRDEVNQAHIKGSWLDIGVSSIRNAFRVSKFKLWCWIGLLLSSIPIHLLFNSTVFETDNREADFHLTISTKDFLKGGAYYPPGASLVLPGIRPPQGLGYGHPVDPSDFNDQNSPTLKNISAIATMAGQWKALKNSDCRRIYSSQTCSGLKEYSDVVLITNRSGWVRDNMWNLSHQDSTFWNRYVPAKAVNHLFFDAQCSMSAGSSGFGNMGCYQDCRDAMGQTGNQSARWDYTFIDNEHQQFFFNEPWPGTENDSNWRISGPQPTALDLSVDYCLVHPLQTTCRVGLVPTLLLLVTICVVVKTVIAIRVTLLLGRQENMVLVTLGDAIASFIEKPDIENIVYCTAGQADISMALTSNSFFLLPEAREWKTVQALTGAALPASVWAQSYLLLLVAVAVCIGLFFMVIQDGGLTGSFFQSDGSFFITNSLPLVGAVLLANSAQLLLSFCYVVYNNLFTRLQLAREWATYSDSYCSLRVTEPQGQQTSTYRLQLPYKYSIPLIGISVLLHWVLSNTIFVLVSTGVFYSSASNFQDPILPDNTVVFVGYSEKALLTLTVLLIVLINIPLLLSLKTLPSNITIPGCNSFALSSACHVSRLSRAVRSQSLSNNTALSGFDSSLPLTQDRSEPNLDDDNPDKNDPGLFRILAQSKLRWGVVEMPPEWYTENGYDSSVGHLSFGVEEDNVSPPINGHLYA